MEACTYIASNEKGFRVQYITAGGSSNSLHCGVGAGQLPTLYLGLLCAHCPWDVGQRALVPSSPPPLEPSIISEAQALVQTDSLYPRFISTSFETLGESLNHPMCLFPHL